MQRKTNFEAMAVKLFEFLKLKFAKYLQESAIELDISRRAQEIFPDYRIALQIGKEDYPTAVITLAFKGAFEQPYVLRILVQYSPVLMSTDDMPVIVSTDRRLMPSRKMGKDEGLVFTKCGDFYGIDVLAYDFDSRRCGLVYSDKTISTDNLEKTLQEFGIHLNAVRITGINGEYAVQDALNYIYEFVPAAGLRSRATSDPHDDKHRGVDASCETIKKRFEIQVKSTDKHVLKHIETFPKIPVVVRHRFMGGKSLTYEDVLNSVCAKINSGRVLAFHEHPVPIWLEKLRLERTISSWYMDEDWDWSCQKHPVGGWRTKVYIITPDGKTGYFYLMAMESRLREFFMYRGDTPAFLLSENLGESNLAKRRKLIAPDEKRFLTLVRELTNNGVSANLLRLATA